MPNTLAEFLDVWCDDLLAPLHPRERKAFLVAICSTHDGGPWPRRLDIQRLVEITQGNATEDAVIGEMLEAKAGGIDGAFARLAAGAVRSDVVRQLGQLAGSPALVARVTGAWERGILTDDERADILGRAMRQPFLPPPIPIPPGLAPVPDGYAGPVGAAAADGPVDTAPIPRAEPGDLAPPPPTAADVAPEPAARRSVVDGVVPGPVLRAAHRRSVRAIPAWRPRRETSAGPDEAPGHPEADAFLRGRGWRSQREAPPGSAWIWPASEVGRWWRPTTIDVVDSGFRVSLAAADFGQERPTETLASLDLLRSEIAAIERWTEPEPAGDADG